jgi:hypothetical protein
MDLDDVLGMPPSTPAKHAPRGSPDKCPFGKPSMQCERPIHSPRASAVAPGQEFERR